MTRVLTEYLVGESPAILSIEYRVENFLLDIIELERSTFMAVARTPWFNLYHSRSRSAGDYWDYYTELSEIGCRGGFGLHPGIVSHGCITVTDRSCFNKIKDVVQRFPSRSFDVTKCVVSVPSVDVLVG